MVRIPVSQKLTTSLFSGNTFGIFPNDPSRNCHDVNKEYLARLRNLGGNDFFLTNPDGNNIHCMHFSAVNFASKLKCAEFALEESGFEEALVQDLKYARIIDPSSTEFNIPCNEDQPQVTEKNNPTVIICGGSGVWFSVYLPMISFFLSNGLDVMAFNYSGYEWSEGTTTEKAMLQDLVTCTEYLKQQHEVEKNNVILYASSLGLGPATKFIKENPHTDLIIDRSFSNLSIIVESELKKQGNGAFVAKIARVALPLVVDFETTKPLSYAKGNIFAVIDADDEMMPTSEGETLEKSISQSSDAHREVMHTKNFGHAGNWLTKTDYRERLTGFLQNIGRARNLNVL